MALVAQEPVLFSQTILENIVYGRVGLPQDDIDVALEQASAKFVYDFQEGLATQVGERSILLSGGQREFFLRTYTFRSSKGFFFFRFFSGAGV